MNIIPIKDVSFDDTATLAMGEAFERARKALRNFGSAITVREIIAKRIIAAAKNGERDPARLCQQALIPFGIEDMSMLFVSVGPKRTNGGSDVPVGTILSATLTH
jgi:hypothetical protein